MPNAATAEPAGAPDSASAEASESVEAEYVRSRHLTIPVAGVTPDELEDSFSAPRDGERRHHAIDILAPRGTPVLAADDGQVLRVSHNALGGNTIYAVDPERRLVYYYAHLDRYREGIAAGMPLARGDTLGFVGTTGNAPKDTPHLHFQLMRWPRDGKYWYGDPIDPFPFLREAPVLANAPSTARPAAVSSSGEPQAPPLPQPVVPPDSSTRASSARIAHEVPLVSVAKARSRPASSVHSRAATPRRSTSTPRRQMPLTSKERAALRAQAHHLSPAVHVGHQGLTESVSHSLDDALRTQELVKIQFAKNADVNVKESAARLARGMHAEVVQVIGRTATLYRHNPELRKHRAVSHATSGQD